MIIVDAAILFIQVLFVVTQVIVVTLSFYSFGLALLGLKRRKEKKHYIPEKTFAVIVPAHNEARVVGQLVDSLHQQGYPRELYDVFVIADNCTDETAEVVRSRGAVALERFDEERRGKQHAVEWCLQQIWSMKRQYDAVVMIDADNLVSPNFLLEMNSLLCQGKLVIQGYLDTKNPDESLMSQYYAIAYWYTNRVWQLSRTNIGLANALGGTGMCIDTEVLKRLGWGMHSVTEDLEFQMKCVMNGIKPYFAWDARVYDEKPNQFGASWRQRVRWMRGHWDVAFEYTLPLLKRAVTKFSLVSFDAALYLLQPSRVLMQYFVLAMFAISFALPLFVTWSVGLIPVHLLPREIWLIAFMLQWVFPPLIIVVLLIERVGWRHMVAVMWFQFLDMLWLPLVIWGLFTSKDRRWTHTQHASAVALHELDLSRERRSLGDDRPPDKSQP